MDCLRQCGHGDFGIVAPCINPGFVMIVTGREGSSLHACPGSYQFVYYQTVVKLLLANTLYMEDVIVPPLSVFFDNGYLQHRGLKWNGSYKQSSEVYFV